MGVRVGTVPSSPEEVCSALWGSCFSGKFFVGGPGASQTQQPICQVKEARLSKEAVDIFYPFSWRALSRAWLSHGRMGHGGNCHLITRSLSILLAQATSSGSSATVGRQRHSQLFSVNAQSVNQANPKHAGTEAVSSNDHATVHNIIGRTTWACPTLAPCRLLLHGLAPKKQPPSLHSWLYKIQIVVRLAQGNSLRLEPHRKGTQRPVKQQVESVGSTKVCSHCSTHNMKKLAQHVPRCAQR